jgi:uncharacterized protein YodC (DUF2158 family)
MTSLKPGDLVTLKSGGPTMTVDSVNTDIFDDNKVTGILCVWFVGNKLERVRFDHMAVEPAASEASRRTQDISSTDLPGEYVAILDNMLCAMDGPAELRAKTRKN